MTSLGDWDLLEVVGEGAHAVVHRAVRRDRPGRVVAIKRLRDVDPTAVAAIRREAAVLADLAHPAIAVLHEVVVDGDEVALVLALATGGSLAQRLAGRGRLPADEVVDLGRRLGNALAAAHAVGVLHRDVTPTNVLYGREDEPRLADFGLSSAVDVPPDEVAGTATHLDPEVANGAPPGPASDTWGLGVLLWESLAGQPPWVGEDDRAVRRAADRGLHLPLGQLVPDAPADLVEVLERSILRDPDRRFRHPQELELALAGLAPDLPAEQPMLPAVPRRGDADLVPDGGGEGASDGIRLDDAVVAGDARPEAVSDDGPVAATPATSGPATADSDVAGSLPTDPVVVVTGADAQDDATPTRPGGDRGFRDDGGPAGGAAGGPPGRTTVFGPRPPAHQPEEPPAAGWRWWTRAAVVLAVVLPLVVAGWAWSRGRSTSAASTGSPPTSATATASEPREAGPTGLATSAVATPGQATASPGPPPTPTATPTATPTGPSSTTPPPAEAATASDPSWARLPAGWVARTPSPPCEPDAPTPAGSGEVVLAADVSGFGCAVAVVVETVELEGRDHTVLEVPEAGGPLAGRYDLGPRRDRVVVGDWNGDGTDTPAVVLPRSDEVFTFGGWGNVDATGTGQRPIDGAVAVATDAAGVDHVVPASSLPAVDR